MELAALAIFSTTLAAAEVLFPQPLHMVRRIDDPVSHATITLHEYAAGNQVVTVNGSRVAIADYAKQQITEIDRAAGTYSITRFDEIASSTASAQAASKRALAATPKPKWTAKSLGAKSSVNGRSLQAFELKADDEQKIEVGVDRSVSLSREAVEVLIGAAFPNPHSDAHDAVLNAASERAGATRQLQSDATHEERFGLPVEQTVTFDAAGEHLTMRSAVVDLTNEIAPADLLTIPPGAQRVESRTTRLLRELGDLDRVPGREPKP